MGSVMMSANTVLMTALVGHLFTLEDVGKFTLSLTTSQVLYAIGLFGLNDQQMTDYGHRYAFADYLRVKIFSTVLAAVACAVFLLVFRPDSQTTLYTVLLTGFMLVNAVAELYQSLYFQNNRLDLSGKSLFFRYLASTAAFAVIIFWKRSIFYAILIMLVVNLAFSVWWSRYVRYFQRKEVSEKEAGRRLLKEGTVLCLCLLGSLLLINAPRYLLRYYYDDTLQGIYSLLFMPTYAVSLAAQFLFKPFLFSYKEAMGQSRQHFWSLLKKHLLIIAGLALVAGAGAWLLGPFALRLLFGQDISAYRNWMFAFLLSGGILASNQLLYYLMILAEKRTAILSGYVAAIAVMLASGVFFIPRFEIGGVWICFTAGQAVLIVKDLFEIRRLPLSRFRDSNAE